jgi:hypothetical protein
VEVFTLQLGKNTKKYQNLIFIFLGPIFSFFFFFDMLAKDP